MYYMPWSVEGVKRNDCLGDNYETNVNTQRWPSHKTLGIMRSWKSFRQKSGWKKDKARYLEVGKADMNDGTAAR